METNETGLDRLVRVILGVVLLALVFVGPRTAWGWVGVVPLFTGLVGFCPLYLLRGEKPCCAGPHDRGA